MNRDELITALQASAAQKPRAVFIKGWGEVFIRALTVAEVEEQTAEQEQEVKEIGADGKEVLVKKRQKNRFARSAARLLCDAKGVRLLDPDNPADVDLLAAQPWELLNELLSASDKAAKVDEAGN